MKVITIIFFFAVIIVLSSCIKNETLTNNLEKENTMFAIDKSSLQLESTSEFDDTLKEITESSMEYKDLDGYVTTLRIHEDLPELTFTRTVNNTAEEQSEYSIPQPFQINIKIEDGDGTIIQLISGLSQSKSFLSHSLTFDDYNFDSYLDMRLMRWQDGAGGLLASEYFWLWDGEIAQFVLNEQLMAIGQATALSADQETRQIVVTHRDGDSDKVFSYEYLDGKFVKTGKKTIWQDSYAELLRKYEECTSTMYFILYDFDKNGIPELIIMGTDANDIYEVVYSFKDGNLVPLTYGEDVSIGVHVLSARTGIAATPANEIGLITYNIGPSAGAFGISNWGYTLIVIENDTLIVSYRGSYYLDLEALNALFDDFGRNADRVALELAIQQHTYYCLNDKIVTEEEFRRIFGAIGNLLPSNIGSLPPEISESNIQKIIYSYPNN